ncbi:MAG: glycosyltransferase family 4 protein, partial [Candidatus Wolfebacteria bacterium]|nr:glycosyltransferase family 4 protein [Candidatus Wolfebacteria bacterium]
RKGIKVIIWSHVTVEDAMQVFRFMPLVAPLFKKYLTYAYGMADLVFCPTEYTKSLLVAYGLNPQKLTAQSNAVDLEKFYEDSESRKSGREKYGLDSMAVGTVGLAIPRKGIDTFLDMAEKFKKNKFMWFGKIYSSFLVKSLPKNLPRNVNFTGHIDNVNEAYNSLDVFIFPSYEENQGMVILEAAAVGLPIIVRDIPVYNTWLVHGENCLKAKTNEEFGKSIKLLLNDGGLRAMLGKQAKILAQKESLESLSKKLVLEYDKVLKG